MADNVIIFNVKNDDCELNMGGSSGYPFGESPNIINSNQMYIDVASYKWDTNLSEFTEVTSEEISNIIKSIDIYKPSEIQNIPTHILKQFFMHKPELLMTFFNKSLQTTIFPESWKIGIVSPIPK